MKGRTQARWAVAAALPVLLASIVINFALFAWSFACLQTLPLSQIISFMGPTLRDIPGLFLRSFALACLAIFLYPLLVRLLPEVEATRRVLFVSFLVFFTLVALFSSLLVPGSLRGSYLLHTPLRLGDLFVCSRSFLADTWVLGSFVVSPRLLLASLGPGALLGSEGSESAG